MFKKRILSVLLYTLLLLFLFLLTSCSSVNIVETFEETDNSLMEEYINNSDFYNLKTYYKLSDNTYKIEGSDIIYKYKIELKGFATDEKNIIFIVLSNREDLTFEEVMIHSGLLSDSASYFTEKDAVVVAFTSVDIL